MNTKATGNTVQVRTICPYGAGMCPCRDGIISTVENGKIVSMEADKENSVSKGYTCAKGLNSWQVIYHPERIKEPMMKTAAGWKEVSWESALDMAAERLGEVKRKYGPLSFSAANVMPALSPVLLFSRAMGSPNTMHNLDLCQGPQIISDRVTTGHVLSIYHGAQDFRNSKCILLVGTDMATSTGGHWPHILHAQKNGAKLIVVDPRRCESAKYADVWLQIRPGTDGALSLGILNVIINEELFDKDFVDNYCVGFDQLRERVQQYIPEKVAEITLLSKEQIVQVARLIGNSKPISYRGNNGMTQQTNSTQASRAFSILTAITGSIDVPGGNLIPTPPDLDVGIQLLKSTRLPKEVEEKRLGAKDFPLWAGSNGFMNSAHIPSVINAMITGQPYPIKSMLFRNANPVVTYPDTRKVIEALKKMEFIIVLGYTPSPTSEFADFVLPIQHPLEQNGFRFNEYSSCIHALPKVVEPPEGALDEWAIMFRLSQKMAERGYIEKNLIPWKNQDEYIEAVFSGSEMSFGELCEKGTVMIEREYRKYTKNGFRTPSGKVELYSALFEKYGYEPLPVFSEPSESPLAMPKLAEEYPLLLVVSRNHDYYGSRSANDTWLRDRIPYPQLQIHPDAATKRGISQGDKVSIETPRGSFRHVADVTEDIHPRVVSATFGWWLPEREGRDRGALEVSINACMSYDPPYDSVVGINSVQNLMCQVRKA
ncbi:molybdopterin-dependent oxidoreductase [Chloroflexota bacterium]